MLRSSKVLVGGVDGEEGLGVGVEEILGTKGESGKEIDVDGGEEGGGI